MKRVILGLLLGVAIGHAHFLELSLRPGESRTVVLASFEPEPPHPPDAVTVHRHHTLKLRDVYLHRLTLEAGPRPVTLRFQSSPPPDRPLAADWAALYRTLPGLLIPASQPLQHGTYLIVTVDALVPTLAPFVQMLKEHGFPVRVATLEQIGTTTTAIKAFLQEAYDTWQPRPEYVLLVGDVDMIGSPGVPTFTFGLDPSDLEYALLDGNDYLPDVFLGRIPVDQALQLQVVVAKTLDYEQVGHPEDTDWLSRALMVASTHYAITTKLTKLSIRDRLLEHGYAQVDTVFWYGNGAQPGPEVLRDAINAGVGIVNYRGWSGALGWSEPPFHIPDLQQLTNGWQLPVLFNITCGAGNFASSVDPCFGEAWLQQGTPTQPRAGVAFVGPTNPSVHTRWNNAIDAGIFQGLLQENLRPLAALTLRGLLQLMQDFPDRTAPGDSVEFYFHVYHTLGEPALQMRTRPPESLQVSVLQYPDCLGGLLALQVSNSSVSVFRPQVAVLYGGDSLLAYGSTDSSGYFEAEIPFLDFHPDSLTVVVTAPEARPWRTTLAIGDNSPLIVHQAFYSDDNDQIPEPGEQGTLNIVVENPVTMGWDGYYVAELQDTGAVLLQDSAWVSSIAGAPDTARFPLVLSNRLADGYTLRFWHGVNACWHFTRLQVQAPAPVALQALGPEGPYLVHGTQPLSLVLQNQGHQALQAASFTLEPATEGVTVSGNPVGPVTLAPGAVDTVGGWSVSVPQAAARGRLVWFRLDSEQETGYFAVPVGPVDATAPTGPDPYGWWVYDDLDTETGQAPAYDWVELEGTGTLYDLGDDSTVVLSLPFTFRFYGEDYSRISVCSNGWLALDSTHLFHFRNWPIPSFHGPARALIAPLWDDLEGRVYAHYDAALHRFAVEWVTVNRATQDSERFEVLLYDPAYRPTPTGDGEVVMQYHTVTNPTTGHYGVTVGIENESHTVGLQYTYGPYAPPSAAPLAPGRALRWTTVPPDTLETSTKETALLSRPRLSPVRWTPKGPEFLLTLRRPGTWHLALYRADGRRVWHREMRWSAGSHRLRLPGSLPSGIYFLRLHNGRKHLQRRFVWLRPGS